MVPMPSECSECRIKGVFKAFPTRSFASVGRSFHLQCCHLRNLEVNLAQRALLQLADRSVRYQQQVQRLWQLCRPCLYDIPYPFGLEVDVCSSWA
jgi:hypothetical protein